MPHYASGRVANVLPRRYREIHLLHAAYANASPRLQLFL